MEGKAPLPRGEVPQLLAPLGARGHKVYTSSVVSHVIALQAAAQLLRYSQRGRRVEGLGA